MNSDNCSLLELGMHSISGAIWQQYDIDDRQVLTIMQRYSLSEVAARVVSARGLHIDAVADFLNPTLRNCLPDPNTLKGMREAVDRLVRAIFNQEKSFVLGDYDVDGATSCALLKRYFQAIGRDIIIYIPDRILEGYGPNNQAFTKFKEEGCTLGITVDCGTVAHGPLSFAKNIGLDVIIIDHHLALEKLPDAVAVVNPNRLDEDFPYRNIAAVGVTFLLLVALNKKLRELDYFKDISEPDLRTFLDLVCVGTICDVMPIIGLNRLFVKHGLKVIGKRSNLGIKSLVDLLKINDEVDCGHVGFYLGPVINAGGRVANCSEAAELLSTSDSDRAIILAEGLISANENRKIIEREILKLALDQACPLDGFLMVMGDWHPGVIGIIASRLKDKFYLPSIVISLQGGVGKASMRGVGGADCGSAILEAKMKGIVSEGGGHAMAGGFSIKEENIPHLRDFFRDKWGQIKPRKVIKFDGYLGLGAINSLLLRDLGSLSPFGSGNPEPKFIIENFRIVQQKVINNSHISCFLIDQQHRVNAIAFRSFETPLGQALLGGRVKSLLIKVKADLFLGASLIIEDAILYS